MFSSSLDSETYLWKVPKNFPETTEGKNLKISHKKVALESKKQTKILTEKTTKKNGAENSSVACLIVIIFLFLQIPFQKLLRPPPPVEKITLSPDTIENFKNQKPKTKACLLVRVW